MVGLFYSFKDGCYILHGSTVQCMKSGFDDKGLRLSFLSSGHYKPAAVDSEVIHTIRLDAAAHTGPDAYKAATSRKDGTVAYYTYGPQDQPALYDLPADVGFISITFAYAI